MAVEVGSGPPVETIRVSQPYAGLEVTPSPATPFRAEARSPRKVTITVHVTEYGKVPGRPGCLSWT
ncbi:hypothetical protein [Streptomyces sp. NPDC003697]